MRQAQMEMIYKENAHLDFNAKSGKFDWIKSFKSHNVKLVSNDSVNIIRKDVGKTRPSQICHQIEDLDQNNRQRNTELRYVEHLNKELRFELEQELSRIQYLKSLVHNSRPATFDKGHVEQLIEGSLSEPSLQKGGAQPGHLNKNLQLHIYLTNNEIKKLEAKLGDLKSSEEYYSLVELTEVLNANQEECERLTSLRLQLENAQLIVGQEKQRVHQSKAKATIRKIKNLQKKQNTIENDIIKAEKFTRDIRAKTQSLIKEEARLAEEKQSLAQQIEAVSSQIQKLDSRLP